MSTLSVVYWGDSRKTVACFAKDGVMLLTVLWVPGEETSCFSGQRGQQRQKKACQMIINVWDVWLLKHHLLREEKRGERIGHGYFDGRQKGVSFS